jgi:muramoyltetrapeptide carboxypeptidase
MGDTIGIVSPSGPILGDLSRQLTEGINFLKRLGLRVVLGKNALNVDDYSAGTPEERAEDVNLMFSDKKIKAVFCSTGGLTANSCTPLLDWKAIRRNPKIFLGMSDVTVLLNAIYAKTSVITFHGNNVLKYGADPTKYDTQELVQRLVDAKIGRINRISERKTVRKGIAEGRLLGGNLSSLLRLAGTCYFPDFSDSILFIEANEITPQECNYAFNQLRQIGVFNKTEGVIIGYVCSLQASQKKLTSMEDILLKITEEYDFPILKMNDFGHNCPNTVLPIGVKARLDAESKELEILERCVT